MSGPANAGAPAPVDVCEACGGEGMIVTFDRRTGDKEIDNCDWCEKGRGPNKPPREWSWGDVA